MLNDCVLEQHSTDASPVIGKLNCYTKKKIMKMNEQWVPKGKAHMEAEA